ncbi:hypothetical protein DSM104443_03593 [Usitatibacter rugosus]|uniref:Putative DNA-binding domain-containing protein n=1 Tax=Usitatibacter rugosus TaxID=2732067 RepID=A0A6M4H3S9_9PROT|nr:DNA-binding domain-containing protein [Usitatibacter rugosus]QJR12507.1 hypothetical protein DSM104443_03593 [Usitatibacter rugosus]
MDALAKLQADFLDAVVDPVNAGRSPALRAGRVGSAERLAIYRRNLHSNWRAALADTHPVVERLVGPAFFGEAARRYALAHPSSSGDLNNFGAGFAAFLGEYEHARELPYLADVARLEWAWHECFHAADAPALDLAALAGVAPERHGEIRFTLHPALRLVESAHPILSIWAANQPERDGTPERLEGADRVLVHRPRLDVEVSLLDARDFALLQALGAGQSFEEAAERAGYDDAASLLGALQRFAADRVLVGFALR